MMRRQAVEKAIERLNSAGLWIQNVGIQWEPDSRYPDDVVFNGARSNPIINKHDDWFSVWQEYGSTYFAMIGIGQGDVKIRSSSELDEIVDAIINYYEIRSVLPKLDRLLWASITDHQNGIPHAFLWLQKAGGSPEILSSSSIRISFPQREYSLKADKESGYWELSASDCKVSLINQSKFEDAILAVLVNEIKVNQIATKA